MINKQGFSLIELMVVIAVLGIITAIAFPSYTQYVVDGNRADVKAEMLRITERFQAYKTINKNYTGLTLASANATANYPSTGTPKYTLALSNVAATTYTLTATPLTSSTQKGDGMVCLNEEGQKFWSKGATACSFTAISSWD